MVVVLVTSATENLCNSLLDPFPLKQRVKASLLYREQDHLVKDRAVKCKDTRWFSPVSTLGESITL